MKLISLWVEGYRATGEHATAVFCGNYMCENLKDAIRLYTETLSLGSQNCIDLEKETFWGCRFFDNEKDARKSFG